MAVNASTPRERRIWADGYAEALADVARAIATGGVDDGDALGAALGWISDNGGPTTREVLETRWARVATREA